MEGVFAAHFTALGSRSLVARVAGQRCSIPGWRFSYVRFSEGSSVAVTVEVTAGAVAGCVIEVVGIVDVAIVVASTIGRGIELHRQRAFAGAGGMSEIVRFRDVVHMAFAADISGGSAGGGGNGRVMLRMFAVCGRRIVADVAVGGVLDKRWISPGGSGSLKVAVYIGAFAESGSAGFVVSLRKNRGVVLV